MDNTDSKENIDKDKKRDNRTETIIETNNKDDDINALSDNKVEVDIDPNVKSNNVNLQLCSCSIILNCFTNTRTNKPTEPIE